MHPTACSLRARWRSTITCSPGVADLGSDCAKARAAPMLTWTPHRRAAEGSAPRPARTVAVSPPSAPDDAARKPPDPTRRVGRGEEDAWFEVESSGRRLVRRGEPG